MRNELVIWATPAGKTGELESQPVQWNLFQQADVQKVIAAATKDGWHSFRVQTIDGKKPNFAAALAI